MAKDEWKSRTKHDLTIEVWEALDCESVGAPELEQIQQVIGERFGQGAVESPASIARTLADEGAVLRHPEVLDCDTAYRQRAIARNLSPDQFLFTTLDEASDSMRKLDSLRRKLEKENDQENIKHIRAAALRFKEDARLMARSKILERKKQLEASEIAQWLAVWLQEPDIFEDWLSLRKRSAEFVQMFGH